jgi:hypothetical protein
MIKAKPGSFRGIQYRSRLEIMWAAFFHNFGIEFVYEPERFDLKSGSYLPDFFLKNVTFVEKKFDSDTGEEGLWFEVKNPIKCTKLLTLRTNKERVLIADRDSKPFKLMSELVNLGLSEKPGTGTVIWYTPFEMYLDIHPYFSRNGHSLGWERKNGIIDSCEPIVLNPYREWESRCMFWKCPECNTISYSRVYHLEEYGLKHAKTCKYYSMIEPRLPIWDTYIVQDSMDIFISGDTIYHGSNSIEKIGRAA